MRSSRNGELLKLLSIEWQLNPTFYLRGVETDWLTVWVTREICIHWKNAYFTPLDKWLIFFILKQIFKFLWIININNKYLNSFVWLKMYFSMVSMIRTNCIITRSSWWYDWRKINLNNELCGDWTVLKLNTLNNHNLIVEK